MSDKARAVRAWADCDEWSGFAFIPEDDRHVRVVAIPKGASGEPYDPDIWCRDIPAGVALLLDGRGPLRSLRVLLSNDEWLLLSNPTDLDGWYWRIQIGADVASADDPGGWIPPASTDAEAVEHALTEAIAYFAAQEDVTV